MDPNENGQGTIDLLREFQRKRRAEQAFEDIQNAVEREARKQARWIETQIWTTDYSEVAVLDVVTFRPAMPSTRFEIKAYRYPTEAEAPEESYYSEQSGMVTEVQRVHRDEFLRIVEEEEMDPPPFLDDADVWDGDYGAGEDTERGEEA